MRIMNNIVNSGDSVNPYRRIPNAKQFSLPTVTKREQNVRSPISIAEYRKRVVSPIQTRNINTQKWTTDQSFNNSGMPSPTFQYTID